MHVDAPAGARRCVGDGGEQLGRAPLHALRAVLHVESRAACGGRNSIDQRELLGDRPWRTDEALADLFAGLWRERGKDRLRRSVDQRIAVAHRDRKADAHADVARGARHLGPSVGRSVSPCTRV